MRVTYLNGIEPTYWLNLSCTGIQFKVWNFGGICEPFCLSLDGKDGNYLSGL